MSHHPSDAVLGELLVRHLDTWLTGALRRSRRVTLALAYPGVVGDSAEAALRTVAHAADRVRGHRLTVLVLGVDPDRLGTVGSRLPAEVTLHLVPGDPGRLPVVLKAAGAAGAPLLTVLSDPTGTDLTGPTARAVAAAGRSAELLLAVGASARTDLTSAGFPLVTEVDTAFTDGTSPAVYALGTRSDRSLESFKESLWRAGAASGLRHRALDGAVAEFTAEPDPGPLAALLHAELARSGPATVTELRRHTLTATGYRAGDAVRALTVLLDSGAVRRDPPDGRLAGDVLIEAVAGSEAGAAAPETGVTAGLRAEAVATPEAGAVAGPEAAR
ncbi:hypothetical protein [Micromonospora cathayae]|uniref:Uncharacterized protein n=1 Tax=Micromonospora cathayae TaxID=3028804 RepID=A0ABY7ZXJ3_9ACTN|nr:hypothetical protein [Micromonospora sp. HUAS 3]WDZ87730.1 hypothetical protein PVK37_15650 [Micromonospora sp. HUAS 3]